MTAFDRFAALTRRLRTVPKRDLERTTQLGGALAYDDELDLWAFVLTDGRVAWYTNEDGKPVDLVAEGYIP